MFLILFKLFSALPLVTLKPLASILGEIMMLFNLAPYKITRKNLNHCFPDDKNLAQLSIQMTAESYLEYPYVWGRPSNYLKLVEHDNEYDDLKNSGKPSLIFTLHMGCVEVMLFHTSEHLDNLNIIYTPTKNENNDQLIKSIRESMGAKLHKANNKGMRELFKNFINRENVIVASDLVPHQKGVYSNFFNKPCFSIDLVEKLSKKDTHDLYFVYFTQGVEKKYKFNLEKIDKHITTHEMNKYFEKAIQKAPELYGWEYKKFRKLEGSLKNIY